MTVLPVIHLCNPDIIMKRCISLTEIGLMLQSLFALNAIQHMLKYENVKKCIRIELTTENCHLER